MKEICFILISFSIQKEANKFITFLPYEDFIETARCLDRQRLGKQRVEAGQILRTLGIEGVLLTPPILRGVEKKQAWINHPAVKMWLGYENALKYYYNIICQEWIDRGYQQNMRLFYFHDMEYIELPYWLGDERFHSSHRASLLAKDYRWYSQFEWEEEPKIEYVWPTNCRGGIITKEDMEKLWRF